MTSSTSSSEPLVSPPPPYARVGAGAAVLALVLPALLVAATLGWLGRPEAEVVTESAELAACRQNMEKSKPDVVIIGNSKAGTDVDRPLLAKALPGTPSVTTVSMPATSGHVWYAMLETCVFRYGAPKLVVAYGMPGALLRHDQASERDRDGIAAFGGADLPAVQAKVLGADSWGPWWDRVERRQAALRTGLQHTVRDGVAGLAFAPAGPEPLLERGRAYAEPALAQVLGADATADIARGSAIPIAAVASDAAGEDDAVTFDASLVPEILALTRDKGARFVYARAPVSEAKATYDAVPPEALRELVERLNAASAGYLDLTTLRLPASAYGDGIHMNAAGRGKLGKALGEALAAMGALGEGTFAAAALPRSPPVATRTGSPPTFPEPLVPQRGPLACGWQAPAKPLAPLSDTALARLGVGASSPMLVLEDGKPLLPHGKKEQFDGACAGASSHQDGVFKFSPTGGPAEVVAGRVYTVAPDPAFPHKDAFDRDLWWVYPGTTARFAFGEPWEGGGAFGVAVELHVALPGEGAQVTVTGAAPVPVVAVGTDAVAVARTDAPTGPWSVEISSPEGGPWLLVRRIQAGDPARPWIALGPPVAPRTVAMLQGDPTFENAQALPTLALTTFNQGEGKLWVAPEAKSLAAPNADVVLTTAGITGCSPLRVSEAGTPLPKPNAPLPKLKAEGGGLYVHKTFGVGLSTPDGSAPGQNGRAYLAFLDPTRTCTTARWVYPGDTARFVVGKALANAFRTGATSLDLTATAFPSEQAPLPEGAALRVRLVVDGVEVLARDVPLAQLDGVSPQVPLPLPAPLAVTPKEAVLELSTAPDAPYVLITGAQLVEPYRSPFDAATAAAE